MTNKDFKIGQEVFKITPYSRSRLTRCGITKVGRKYIEVDDRIKFHIDTLQEKTDYGVPSRLYLSEKDYRDKLEKDKLRREIAKKLGEQRASKLDLQTLRNIDKLINNKL